MDAGNEPSDRLLHRLIDGGPQITVVVDGLGQITYSSANVQTLFGYRPDEVLGTNIFDYLDTDFSPDSMDSIGAALGGSGLQRPMVFRLIHKDGHRPVVEVTANSQLDDPDVHGLIVYVRPWGERWLLDQVLDSIAGSASLETTFGLLVDVMRAETLEADGLVLYHPGEDQWLGRIAAEGLGPAQANEIALDNSPWSQALETGQPVRQPVRALPPALRAEAEQRGHAWCWAWPVAGPQGPEACLVLWRRHDEDADHTCRVSVERLVGLTELVLAGERSAADLRFAASHDVLTGLANRAQFLEELRVAVDRKEHQSQVGVLYLDLDGFKPVNDEHGHGAGDLVLREVSSRLSTVVRAGDLVARLGGDEFTVLCPGVTDPAALSVLAARLVEAVAEPIDLGDETVTVSATIGIAVAPHNLSVEELVQAADGALYEAKREARGSWRVAGQ